jgi:predicted DNA-binding antitoxin AbrB/MazE fold protein
MTKTIEAVYENGILRPVEPLEGIENHRRVTITVHAPEGGRPLDGWVGGLSDEDAARMRQVIEEEFEQVNPDEWK